MEYFCFEGDGLWEQQRCRSDRAGVPRARAARAGAGAADVVDGTVIRMPKAYPIYDCELPRASRRRSASYIDPIPNLHTVGRNGMHKYNNQDHSMLTAMMAVWNMQGAAHDIWSRQHRLRVSRGAEAQKARPVAPAGAGPIAMRIGVDATCWANPGATVASPGSWCRRWPPSARRTSSSAFVDERAAGPFDLRAPNVGLGWLKVEESPTTEAAADGTRYRRSTCCASRGRSAWARLDVFFSPSVYTYFPLPPGLRAVVTVHDAIAERFPRLTLPIARARLFWSFKVRLALARLVLTVSDFAAGDIADHPAASAQARIRVALEAPPPEHTLARLVHSGALALVLPSACDGFGLPAVEAAACGTPGRCDQREPASPAPWLAGGARGSGDQARAHRRPPDDGGRRTGAPAMGERARVRASERHGPLCARRARAPKEAA